MSKWPASAIAAVILSSSPSLVFLRYHQFAEPRQLVTELMKNKLPLVAYNINSCEELKLAVEAGADGIMTDALAPTMCK